MKQKYRTPGGYTLEIHTPVPPEYSWRGSKTQSLRDFAAVLSFATKGVSFMPSVVERRTVDLSAFPDLVVIYLGMRVRALAGIKRLAGLGPQIGKAGAARPEGLLHFENNIIYSLFPLHIGMRWYWRDFESMERWARSEPHRIWWQDFLRSSGGTGFWHETYFMRGGMEAIYDDVNLPAVGFQTFAPSAPARGSMFSARTRLHLPGEAPAQPAGVTEQDLSSP